MRGAVAAVAYCHQRDVVHGSLGAGSLLLSTYEDLRWQEVIVKLDNFGFARQYPSAGQQRCISNRKTSVCHFHIVGEGPLQLALQAGCCLFCLP